MFATDELCSFLELCFSDAEDDEGLADIKLQLSIYTERAVEFRDQLGQLLGRAQGEECRAILSEYTHQHMTSDEALEWFRWLDRGLRA